MRAAKAMGSSAVTQLLERVHLGRIDGGAHRHALERRARVIPPAQACVHAPFLDQFTDGQYRFCSRR
jgi:hypothetical protein